MALGQITFTRTNGNLNIPLPGEDYISALLVYGSKPVPFGSADTLPVYSVKEAEELGLDKTFNAGVPHYHVKEYFRINPRGKLQLMVATSTSAAQADSSETQDFESLATLQRATEGEIRQVAVFVTDTFAESQVTALQAIATLLEGENMPLSILYAADFTALTKDTLPDLSGSDAKNVSVVVGEDGAGDGAALVTATGKSVTCLGATLGAVSLAAVHQSIAWINEFNVAGSELNTLNLSTGEKIASLAKTALDGLDNKRYLFLIKYVGRNGSFFNGEYTADNPDYGTISNNRSIDKAVRGVRQTLLPLLNSPVYVQDDGTLDPASIASIESEASRPLDQMEREGELSGYQVVIDPAQKILETETLKVDIEKIGVGVVRNFDVSIGYVTELT